MSNSKYEDLTVQFDVKPDMNKLKDYLQQYHLITENNAYFLTVGDPSKDKNVQTILDNLNRAGNGYRYAGPFFNGKGTVKAIYDGNFFTTNQINMILRML